MPRTAVLLKLVYSTLSVINGASAAVLLMHDKFAVARKEVA
jgi:hypothetical protein